MISSERRQHDDFLADVDALPDLAGGHQLDARLVRVERENIAGFELHRRRQLVLWNQRHAEILDVQHLARQRGDDPLAGESAVTEHLANQVGDERQSQLRLFAGGERNGLSRGGDHRQRLTHHLDLQHLDAVAADVEPDGLNL